MEQWIRQVLQSSQLTLAVLPAAFLLGLLAGVSSCCNLAALGAIAGYSATRKNIARRATMLAGLFFMFGTIIALAVLGALAGFVSQAAGNALGRYWKIFAGLAAIFFGLAALNLVPFKLPTIGSTARVQPRGLLGAAVFGLVIGGSATTCSACCNPLIAVPLGAAALQGNILWGAAILGAFAVGFSLLLTAILLGFSLGKSTLRAKKAATAARVVGGLLLVGVGFYFLLTVY